MGSRTRFAMRPGFCSVTVRVLPPLFSRRPSVCTVVQYHAFTRVAVVLTLPGEWCTFRSGVSPLVHLHSAGPARPVPLGTSCWGLGLKNPVGSGSVKVNYTQPHNAGVTVKGRGVMGNG